MRPLYVAKCAPLRWYRKLNSSCVHMSWRALTSDPCVYRYMGNAKFCGVCVTHVDYILFTGNPAVLHAFERVVSQFTNSVVSHLGESNSLIYLGLDIKMKEQSIQISQQPYAEGKIRELAIEDLIVDRKFITPEHKRRTAAKQIIGSLL